MTGMSGPNTPPNDFSGYHPPTSGPSSGANQPAPDSPAANPPNPGAAFAGGPPTGTPPSSPESPRARQPAPGAPSPAAPAQPGLRAAPATRPVTRPSGRRGSARGSRDERDPNERFQGLVTAIGLAIGLLFIAGGGLMNATVPMPGVDPIATATSRSVPFVGQSTGSPTITGTLVPAALTTTATIAPTASTTAGLAASATATPRPRPTATATTSSGTATPTDTPTPVPAKLSITPPSPISDATCANSSTLATLTLSNTGAASLQWSASVSAPSGDTVTLSKSTGQLNGSEQDSINVTNAGSNDITTATIQITFTTTPTSAAPAGPVTITCA